MAGSLYVAKLAWLLYIQIYKAIAVADLHITEALTLAEVCALQGPVSSISDNGDI